MKKVFGIIFLVLGLILVGGGVAGLVDLNSKSETFDGRFRDAFNPSYRERNSDQKSASTAAIASGAILFIIGIIMLATNTNIQHKKEVDLATLMHNARLNRASLESANNEASQTNNKADLHEIIQKIEKLGKLKEQGLLTSEEFEFQKAKLLN